MTSPWTTLDTELKYENPWIAVEHHNVLNPAGGKGIYGKVHFKNMAIGIVPVDHEMHTYLVGQWRYTLNEYSWEIPEGGGPHSVSALDSAKRELEEETGLQANIWTELGRIHTSNSVTDEFGYAFLAQDLAQGRQQLEDTEADIRVKRLSLAKAVEMVMQGEISDALSVFGLLKAARLLKV